MFESLIFLFPRVGYVIVPLEGKQSTMVGVWRNQSPPGRASWRCCFCCSWNLGEETIPEFWVANKRIFFWWTTIFWKTLRGVLLLYGRRPNGNLGFQTWRGCNRPSTCSTSEDLTCAISYALLAIVDEPWLNGLKSNTGSKCSKFIDAMP